MKTDRLEEEEGPETIEEVACSAGGTGGLTPEEFRRRVLLPERQMKILDELIERPLGRNSAVRLQAIRTKLEYGYSKPEQAHAVSGVVSIIVQSAVPIPGSLRAKALQAQPSLTAPSHIETRNAAPAIAPAPKDGP